MLGALLSIIMIMLQMVSVEETRVDCSRTMEIVFGTRHAKRLKRMLTLMGPCKI